MCGGLHPLKEDVVPHDLLASRAKRVALQREGQHPEVKQQDLSGAIGGSCEVCKFVGCHVVRRGVEGDELEAP